ncbi:MAG: hypothetical protein IKT60_06195 [Clostridia bacterium]|nr:hypothetical protein [Clostridia bacterium]
MLFSLIFDIVVIGVVGYLVLRAIGRKKAAAPDAVKKRQEDQLRSDYENDIAVSSDPELIDQICRAYAGMLGERHSLMQRINAVNARHEAFQEAEARAEAEAKSRDNIYYDLIKREHNYKRTLVDEKYMDVPIAHFILKENRCEYLYKRYAYHGVFDEWGEEKSGSYSDHYSDRYGIHNYKCTKWPETAVSYRLNTRAAIQELAKACEEHWNRHYRRDYGYDFDYSVTFYG